MQEDVDQIVYVFSGTAHQAFFGTSVLATSFNPLNPLHFGYITL